MLKALALIAFILLSLASCAGAGNIYTGPVNPQPKQDQAISIVFNAFNVPFDPSMAPPIVWRFDESCTDATGTYANTFMMGPGCNYGIYDDNNNLITVEAFGTFSAGSMAHELAHAVLYYTTGNGDYNHKSNYFNGSSGLPQGQGVGSLVEKANAALAGEGL